MFKVNNGNNRTTSLMFRKCTEFLVSFFTYLFHVRFKIKVIVDYYPKNLFLGGIFNDGIFKGGIWERFIKT